MDPFNALATKLVGGAQERYIVELSMLFLRLFSSFTREGKVKLRGREIADFETLAYLSRTEAMAIYGQYRDKIDARTRKIFRRTLVRTDDTLTGILTDAFGKRQHVTNLAEIIASQVGQGMSEILHRQNIAMAEHQAQLWYEVTAEAIARQQSGELMRDVMERGVTALADDGLETIDYTSGVKTQIDAALRRHIVTQANQARNRLLTQRMYEWEHDLVYVSAHFGARPSHAVWQGKVYSISGRDSHYPSLVEVTGYGTVTGLCGANCRHTMTPYVPGFSRLPDTSWSAQERLVGMSSDEYYAATQRQRRLERQIRGTKRALVYQQDSGLDETALRVKLGAQQKRVRELVKATHLRRDYERERVWGVERQPRALQPIFEGHAVQRMKERGVSKASVHDALENPLYIFPEKIDRKGQPAKKFLGRSATIVLNPQNGKLITVYPTKSRYRRKYEKDQRQDKAN